MTNIARLQAFIEDWDYAPMIWGESDCACMAAAVLREVYGRETILGKPRYRTEQGALRYMKALGVADLAAGMDTAADRIGLAYAMPGDIIGFPTDAPRWGVSLGLMVSDRRALVIDPETASWRMLGDVQTGLMAWRVA